MEDKKPELVLLNGPSSAGKSSIAKALRKKLCESGIDAFIISLDDYLQMSVKQPIWEDDVFEVMPLMCRDIASALSEGKTLIVDHVITSQRIFRALALAAAGFTVKTVLVTCSPEILRKREAARGDRCAGTAEMSRQYLYPKTGYDLDIDSTETRPQQLAERILEILQTI